MNSGRPSNTSEKSDPSGLALRSLGALKWNYLGTGIKVLSQLVVGIVLARLLGPKPFGLIAIAWLMLGLGNLIADSGLSVTLIQRPHISSRDIRFVFSLQMLCGLLLTLLVLTLAPMVAIFFARPDAIDVLRWMSLLFVMQAFGHTSSALLRRDLDHKRVQLIQVATYLLAFLLLGLPLAYSGFGVWALVTAQLTQATLFSLAAYLSMRHSLMPALRADQPGLFHFGTKVLGSNLTSWGISNLDSAIIGRMLGVTDLGLYNRSMNLVSSPMNATVSTLMGVLLPLYSRLQHRPEAARDTYLATLCLMSALLAPAFSAVAVMPETTVLAVYGMDWQSAAVLIAPLALAMPVNAVLALGGPMMQGLGHAGLEAASQGFGLLVLVVGVIVAASISLEAVGWVVLAVYCLRALLVTRLAAGLVSIPVTAILRALAGPVVLGMLAALLGWQLDTWLATWFVQPGLRFVFAIGLNASVILSIVLVGGRWLFCSEARALLLLARPHLPSRLDGMLARWSRV
jgi:O-antigen/teichoic acid export membrane protein